MSLFRNTVWYLKGLREYTREGYNTAAKSFQVFHCISLNIDCFLASCLAKKNTFLSSHFQYTGLQAGELEVDCSGLSYLVTGANSGLGKQTARELASRGGTVHLVCRNPDTGSQCVPNLTAVYWTAFCRRGGQGRNIWPDHRRLQGTKVLLWLC